MVCRAMVTPTPESVLEVNLRLREENERLKRRKDAKVIEELEDQMRRDAKLRYHQTETHARYVENMEREQRWSAKEYKKMKADRIRILKKAKRQEKEIINLKKQNEEYKNAYDFMSIVSEWAYGVFHFLGERACEETANELISTRYMERDDFKCFNPDWLRGWRLRKGDPD